jgi:enoyl-CoA hydratase/carnithine racemase
VNAIPVIGNVRIDRPHRANALDLDAMTALIRNFRQIQSDPGVVAFILSGNSRNFCAGVDMSSIDDDPLAMADAMFDLLRAAASLNKPMVAHVKGAAAGAGWLLAACAQSVVAAPDAVFSLPEVHAGIPAFAALALLQPRLPRGLLQSALLTGRPIAAEELAACGFLSIGDETAAHEEAALLTTAGSVFADLMRHAREPLLIDLARARAASLEHISSTKVRHG